MNADDWAVELIECYRIHVTHFQRMTSITRVVAKIKKESHIEGLKAALRILQTTSYMNQPSCVAALQHHLSELENQK